MTPVNIAEDEKMLDAVKCISEYCEKHKGCDKCVLMVVDTCLIEDIGPHTWSWRIEKILSREAERKKYDPR